MKQLEFKNASYGYSKAFHLSDVNFSVKQGEFVGVIGPNGSGKSTLLKGVSGEIEIPKNQLYIHGIDLSSMSQVERAREIAVVTQFSDPIDITVEDYVLTGRIPYRKKFQFFENEGDLAIAEKYMELTDTLPLRNKKFSELSGGEQQLVSIAKALIQEPSLLLLDEPTSHLDISHQVQVLDLIHELSKSHGLTVLLIIHDLNLASEYCDQLVMMKKGRVFKAGSPKEIINYQNIEEVYQTVVVTEENPLTKKPNVFLVSKSLRDLTQKKIDP